MSEKRLSIALEKPLQILATEKNDLTKKMARVSSTMDRGSS